MNFFYTTRKIFSFLIFYGKRVQLLSELLENGRKSQSIYLGIFFDKLEIIRDVSHPFRGHLHRETTCVH